MVVNSSVGRKIFLIFNVIFLSSVAIICILPFIHLFSISVSSNISASAGQVGILPKGFSLESYKFLTKNSDFLKSIFITIQRTALGTVINMFLVIITAYPLSKENSRFRFRTLYVWFFAFTMFFSGGMIPGYMVVKETGILDSMLALVLPGALNVWNLVMLLNFFRSVPKDLEEAAIIDGAGQWKILWKIFIPVSVSAIATILLFTVVGHWNAWFDGILYLNTPDKYPLQTYLSTVVMDSTMNSFKTLTPEELELMKNVSNKTLKSAQIFLGALPILLVYPFMQRFFIKGIVVGSVKG